MSFVRRTLVALALLTAVRVEAQAPVAASEPRPALTIAVQNRSAADEAAKGAARRDSTVRPGDVLRYTLTFVNQTAGAIRNVQLRNELPSGLVLVAGTVKASRSDAQAEYSADGGKTYSATPTEEVVVDGKTVRRPVPPAQYTHVRWTVNGAVAPQATVTAEYDTRVSSGARNPTRGAAPSSPRSGSR
jgi:uncharacterized repeat protein (TIGR01451 family)